MGRGTVDWDDETLTSYYDENAPDLSWLDKPARHHFRWRERKGRWRSAPRRSASGKKLVRMFRHRPPRDLYVGTASWLDPINLPKLRDKRKPPPILLDHLVVFDIDMRPFSHTRLERARRAAVRLVDYIEENENLEWMHAVYSGGKGFHLVFRDPDREKFGIPDPREREAAVREVRKELMGRLLEAGHTIDPAVTSDTRRIIRLPGSVHGTTGWVCTILSLEQLRMPIKQMIATLPRHPRSIKIPRWAYPPTTWPRVIIHHFRARRLQRKKLKERARSRAERAERKKKEPSPAALELQASTHVTGTKDRSALLWWLPRSWADDGDPVKRALGMAEILGLSPAAFWKAGDRILMLVPRAIPKTYLARHSQKHGIGKLGYHIDVHGHSWIGVSPRLWESGQWTNEIEPIGQLDANTLPPCKHPWSAAHLDLARRLGQPILATDSSPVSGRPEPKMRLAKIR